MTIVLAFRHDVDWWNVDDIDVVDSITGLSVNRDGGFESNNLTAWYEQCNPENTCWPGEVLPNYPRTGSYSYYDGAILIQDYLLQSFSVVAGRWYSISLWLRNGGDPPNRATLMVGS